MSQETAQPTPAIRSNGLRIWLIIDTVLSALAILPAAMMGMMSVMATDSGVNTAIYTFIITMMTFPLALLVCPILAWVAYALRRQRIALIVSLLPALWGVALVAILTIGWGTPHPA